MSEIFVSLAPPQLYVDESLTRYLQMNEQDWRMAVSKLVGANYTASPLCRLLLVMGVNGRRREE